MARTNVIWWIGAALLMSGIGALTLGLVMGVSGCTVTPTLLPPPAAPALSGNSFDSGVPGYYVTAECAARFPAIPGAVYSPAPGGRVFVDFPGDGRVPPEFVRDPGMLGQHVRAGWVKDYAALAKKYGKDFLPAVKPGDGVTALTDGTYSVDLEHLGDNNTMAQMELNGMLP